MNQIDLNGRIAVITGGSGGIGQVTAERMRRSGATVVLWDLDVAGGQVDVTDEAAVARRTAETIAQHGRIDILVNAAGTTSHSTQLGLWMWRAQYQIVARPIAAMTTTCASPLYQGDMRSRYSARNWAWRGVIIGCRSFSNQRRL